MRGLAGLLSSLERRAAKRTFPLWEKLGFHITANHFEEPVPTLSELSDEVWSRESELLGIEMNEGRALDFLRNACERFKPEYDSFGLREPQGDCPYYVLNGCFGEVDGDVLYCVVRHFKPRRIVEIGSGWSTCLSAHALRRNEAETGCAGELIAIEPYPKKSLKQGTPGLTRLIEDKVQSVGFELFESLAANDILFIDSSHVARIGSDVNYEILEILPRLKRGVLVHFHDIFLPYEYPKRWVKDLRIFYSEMYLLHAFLMYNASFEVIWAGRWMKARHPELMRRLFRGTASQSFWMRRAS